MKVGIYGQFYHEGSEEYIQELLEVLHEENIEVVIERHFLALILETKTILREYASFSTFEELDRSYDFFFSIGGDGTILKTVTYVRDLEIPIVGINTGRLGFLATINKAGIKKAIASLLQKKYSVLQRSLLCVETSPENKEIGETNFALNEIAISRKNSTAMLTINVWLDGEYLNAYWADGLIVATPTGSTGYSLSCGGPIISPRTNALIITPIAAHNLNVRPLVIPDDRILTLQVSGRDDAYLLSMDYRVATFNEETRITVKKAPFKISLVLLEDSSFIKNLRKKLLWGEDKRNKK